MSDSHAKKVDEVHEAVFSEDTLRPGLLKTVSHHSELLQSNDPKKPGLLMRTDRLEKLLDTSWKFLGVLGSLLLLYKVADAVIAAMSIKRGGP